MTNLCHEMKEVNEMSIVEPEIEVLPFKAIIFDMDGTLLESTTGDYKAWEKVFNDYGKQLTYQDYVPLLGIKSAEVIRKVLGVLNEDDVTRILKEKYDYFVEYVTANPVQPVDHAEDLLKALQGQDVLVGLATSSRRPKVDMIFEQLGYFQYFDTIVTGNEIENSKPAPDIFLKAAERLGLQPDECVVVEDGPIGVQAAKNANMKCIAITTTHPAEKLQQADMIIDTYEGFELKEVLNVLGE